MKKLLSKYWKNILMIIGAIFIIINIANKCMAPHTLISEVAKYGPDIQSSGGVANIIDKMPNTNLDTGSVGSSIMNGEMMKICIITAVALVGVSILGDLANKKAAKKKK